MNRAEHLAEVPVMVIPLIIGRIDLGDGPVSSGNAAGHSRPDERENGGEQHDQHRRHRHARAVAMIGPGAGCLPEPLFKRGWRAGHPPDKASPGVMRWRRTWKWPQPMAWRC